MKPELWFKYAGIVLCFLVISFFGYWYAQKPDAKSIKVVTGDFESGEKIIVTVAGEVKEPGEYSVAKGTTVYDCIRRAGGITKKGNPESVDPDKILYEPCKIEVGEASEYDQEAQITYGDYSPDNLCNINTATKDMLIKLPGIGEKIAADIINYRETMGKFTKKEHIQNISGIGKSKYEKIKDLITVGGAK